MAFGDRPGERSHFYLRDAFADDRLAGFQARQHTYVPAVGGAELHFSFGIPLVVELHEYEVNTLILRYGAQRHGQHVALRRRYQINLDERTRDHVPAVIEFENNRNENRTAVGTLTDRQ